MKLLRNFQLNKSSKQANLLLPIFIYQVSDVVEVLYESSKRLFHFQEVEDKLRYDIHLILSSDIHCFAKFM